MKAATTMQTGQLMYFHLNILLYSMNIIFCSFPVNGFSLKSCRISYSKALCISAQLTEVPQDIPPILTGFDLSVNKIPKIQASDFKNQPHLISLNLKHNKISQIAGGAFSNLIALKVLNLNNNKLVALGDSLFDGLSNLTELRIVNNGIKSVSPSTFKPLGRLQVLDLSSNKLVYLFTVSYILQHVPNLRELNIKQNTLWAFMSEKLSNKSIGLMSLDLSQNHLSSFTMSADVFPNLTWLNLSGTAKKRHLKWEVRNTTFLRHVSILDISSFRLPLDKIKMILESFNSSLTNLRMNSMKNNIKTLVSISCSIPTLSTLQLQNNQLTAVAFDFFPLCTNVTEIDLSQNQIVKINENAFKPLEALRILNLRCNRLSSVPSAIRNQPTLVELDLSSNKIRALGCQDFANLIKLRELSLNQNSLSALTNCTFRELINLQVLKLQHNSIASLYGSFQKYLPTLKILHLNSNKLTTIAREEFMGLRSLQNLSLQENQINYLDKGAFNKLRNLSYLQLQSNGLEASGIQNVFSTLKNLQRLDLSNNRIRYRNDVPLSEPPFSQLSQLEYLFLPSQHHRGKGSLPRNLLQGLTNLLYFDTRDSRLASLHANTFNYTPRLKVLYINSNEKMAVSPDLFAPISNLKSLYISRTTLGSLNILQKANLTKLEFLQARMNQFSVISKETIKSLPALLYLDLQNDTFYCNCDNAWFLQWVKDNNQTQVFDAYNFVCQYPQDLAGTKLLELDVRSCSLDTEFICFLSTTCVIVFFMAVTSTYHFLRWHLVYGYYFFLALLFDRKQKNKQTPHQYDAFVSYNIYDEPWVFGELLPKLEEEQGWKLCLHHRDFLPGKPIIDNITDAIYGCRKTICVISHHYLESEWCSREIQMASFRLFDERKDVLIMVFLEEIPTRQLSPYYRMRKLLKKQTYLSWPRAEQHTQLFWEKLNQALQTRQDHNSMYMMDVTNAQ